ncbi:hypothetical protein L6452_15968 [Arctium lappa]|uniref:Uncharacterized protein n=2 Tax=Arctium lappa TaxID=4217 RepID=A0ACB9CQ80_ARCLA|nr:hypothetical protein L6452_15966 [Arctium lappa]KAI3736427.1 hypothetical protein L6452_15968 [Arctium lappa]
MSSEPKREIIHSKEEVAAQEEIWKYILGFTPIALVKCAIELGIPDILENHETPMTLLELTSKLGCNESSLYRIMRFLIHYKIFQEKPVSETSVGYALTPLSRLLTRHGQNSMADFVLLESSPVMLAPWHKLSAWVLGNKELPFEAAHDGKDLWGFTAANPSHSKLFDDAMACDARVAVAAVIEGCSEVFEGLKTMVDVGGGDGTALRLIVKAFPWIKGINFDLPHVVSVARAFPGVEHVGGNMFDHVPKANAAYLMKVLHDWRDEECINILKKCREAIPQDTGKVIIVEAIIGRKGDHEFKEVGLMLDMVMMAHTSNGKERTLEEWSYVFHEAGFSCYTVKHIQSYHSVIEVYP